MLKLGKEVAAVTVIDRKELEEMFQFATLHEGDLGFPLREFLEMAGWTLTLRRNDPECLMDVSYELVEPHCLQTRTLTSALDLLAMANEHLEHHMLQEIERIDPDRTMYLHVAKVTDDAIIYKLIDNRRLRHERF